MKLSFYLLNAIAAACSLWASLAGANESGGFLLSREVMEISYEAARLSNLSYANVNQESGYFGEQEAMKRDTGVYDSTAIMTPFSHPDFMKYRYIHFYTQEPDQALIAKTDDRCFVAFRGTNVDLADWLQNLNPSTRVIHRNNDTSLEGCEVREGFVEFLQSDAILFGLRDVTECMNTISCDDATGGPCLVITGHSQGGASAAVASVLLHWLNPTVATFGQPPTLMEGCDSVPSERYYRYINSIKEADEDDDVAFDPVVFSESISAGATQYGHAILLGEDATAVMYLGMDKEGAEFTPTFLDRQNELAAHLLGGNVPTDYDWRIRVLLENFPIATDGFSDGSFCDRSYHDLCASGWCTSENVCANRTVYGAASAVRVAFPATVAVLSSFLVFCDFRGCW